VLNRYTLAGLVSVLGVVGIVALAVAAFGGTGEAPKPTPTAAPPVDDLAEAVRVAGCTLGRPPNEGAAHADKAFTASDYNVNPPTSGTHTPEWAPDGVYKPGDTPELGNLVHTLEHGRVNIQYRRGTPVETIKRLETLVLELDNGYHQLLYENTTGMEAAVAATAWDRLLTCPEMNDRVFDALRAFRAAFIDQGPEQVP
jgi:hypothetical protein